MRRGAGRRRERPVILAGHGVLLSHAERGADARSPRRQACRSGTTLLGIGAFPVQHPLSLHMTGFMGTGWNLKAVQNADVLMMVGMRVDDRVTARLADFAPKSEDVHPHRHRRLGDGQERAAPHRAGRRRARRARGDDPAYRPARRRPRRVAHPDRCVARGAPAQVHAFERPPAAAGRADRHVQALPQRCDRRRGRRPEPDLGRAVVELRPARAVHQLRRRGHDGLRAARRDRRQVRRGRTRPCGASPARAGSS